MIEVLRTPEERFENLLNFEYSPKYVENLKDFENIRMHYIDEGPKDAEYTFLCLHGQPTWSYLYRKMIPIFLEKSFRVVAPDFFGFGRSDKPVKDEIYTFEFHRDSLISFLDYVDISNIILVCQDWGGILGLTLPMVFPESFDKLILMNTALGTGDFEISQGFKAFRKWVNDTPDMDVGRLMMRSTPDLIKEEVKAYDAPFPEKKYKAGVRMFPNLVPTEYNAPGADISRKAREWFQTDWKGDAFMAVGMQDPVLGLPMMKILRSFIPRCSEPLMIKEAGHFVQEWGYIVVEKALKYFNL